MKTVSASVHEAWIFLAVSETCLFIDRKRIHIGRSATTLPGAAPLSVPSAPALPIRITLLSSILSGPSTTRAEVRISSIDFSGFAGNSPRIATIRSLTFYASFIVFIHQSLTVGFGKTEERGDPDR